MYFRSLALRLAIAAVSCAVAPAISSHAQSNAAAPISVPPQANLAGRSAGIAAQSVFRIVCPDGHSMGTGFLHKSGMVITAGHVIAGCKTAIIFGSNFRQNADVIATDTVTDLALLKPVTPLHAQALRIYTQADVDVGAQIAFWGFPGGYSGSLPLLATGAVSGIESVQMSPTESRFQFVLNAAINHGNSGGPVVLIGTGDVIGVVDNKIVPLSPDTLAALSVMKNQTNGVSYGVTRPDGTSVRLSEAQVLSMVLNDLSQQVQLVVGRAITAPDICKFLKNNKLDC